MESSKRVNLGGVSVFGNYFWEQAYETEYGKIIVFGGVVNFI